VDKPRWQEIEPGHFVLANEQEMEGHREQLATSCRISS